jgi:hypothetical protein
LAKIAIDFPPPCKGAKEAEKAFSALVTQRSLAMAVGQGAGGGSPPDQEELPLLLRPCLRPPRLRSSLRILTVPVERLKSLPKELAWELDPVEGEGEERGGGVCS